MGTFQINGKLSVDDEIFAAKSLQMGSTSVTDGPAIKFPSNKRNYIWMGYANDNGSWYIWDSHNSKGIIASDINGNNTFYGNAASATKLATARTISLTGSVTGSGSFDGSGNLSITTTTNHSHSYLPLSGGTMTGTITSTSSSALVQVLNDASNWRHAIIWRNTTQESGTYLSGIGRHNTGGNSSYPGCIGILPYATNSSPWDRSVGLSISKDNMFFEGKKFVDSAGKVYGAVWNDYAEYRICNEDFKPGQVVCENNDDTLSIAKKRLQPGANIVSDTFGFAIGETNEAKCPIAVSGRVLAYTYEPREKFQAGDAVCAAPGGTVSRMTREEIIQYPERIIGTVSSVPSYDTWGTGNVKVDNRIWIKVK